MLNNAIVRSVLLISDCVLSRTHFHTFDLLIRVTCITANITDKNIRSVSVDYPQIVLNPLVNQQF